MSENLIGELKRRKVFKVGAAYLVVAWLAVQGASIGFPAFEAPAWALRIFILVALLGFPVALVMAWVFESTPEGVAFDPVKTGTKRILAIAVVLSALALAWYFKGQPAYRAGDADVGAAFSREQSRPKAAPTINEHSIAVLPFENLSDAKANEYFVSGMQDMILTSLSKLRDLKVISRTSTEKYASRPENLKQVAAELGVAYILEGSVQRAGDQVLINLQLIDARSDTHLWAESFDRKVEDVFSVEREVAGLVADALRTTLLPAERANLGAAPTANQVAYDLFLRAEFSYRKYGDSQEEPLLREAIAHYEQAVAADPGFALAHAHLSLARARLYWDGGGTGEPRRLLAEQTRAAAEAAKRLSPELPDADLALADYQYRIGLDYPGALAAYDAVLARQARNPLALQGRAWALRRLGRYDEAIAAFSAATLVDPRDNLPFTDRGLTNFLAGYLDQAEADFRRALSLNPEDVAAARRLGELLFYRDGDIDGALRLLRPGTRNGEGDRVLLLARQRKYDEALAVIDRAAATGVLGDDAQPLRATVLRQAGRLAEARAAVKPLLPELRATVAALPANSGGGQAARYRLASAEGTLGNTQAALEQIAKALATLPPERDLANGSIGLGDAAAAYAQLGRLDLALPVLARIRQLKGTDMQTSAATLRLTPVWDPYRTDPRFQAELARFEARAKRG
jgi:TolB-like protein/Flp pilus assembly protein TadD